MNGLMTDYEIALATDHNYIVPTTVLIKSLFENNKDFRFVINILYLNGKLLESDISFFRGYIENFQGNVRFLPVSEELLDVPECRHTKSTYLRLFLPQVMPQNVDKVLYLDSDIIIAGSIKELLDLDIDNYSIAAVKESINIYDKSYLNRLDIPEECDYFNAGVIYLNLKKMREKKIVMSFFSYLTTHVNVIKANDQDILNGVLYGDVKYISPRYNYNFWIEKDVALQLFSEKEYMDAWNNPCVIHYIGPVKPWQFISMHPKKKMWWRYLKMTPFSNYKPIGRNLRNIILYPYFLLLSELKRLLTMKIKQRIGYLIPNRLKMKMKKNLFSVQ